MMSSTEISRASLSLGARLCQSIQRLSESNARSAAWICVAKSVYCGEIFSGVKTKPDCCYKFHHFALRILPDGTPKIEIVSLEFSQGGTGKPGYASQNGPT
jgi:hypothetical protein